MPDSSQEQSQSLTNSIQISVDSSGDVELERQIFGKVSSVGRQLGTVSAVLEHVLAALATQGAPGFAANAPGELEALQKFRKIQADIAREKAERDFARLLREPERLLRALERLAREEPDNYAKLKPGLTRLLVDSPPPTGA